MVSVLRGVGGRLLVGVVALVTAMVIGAGTASAQDPSIIAEVLIENGGLAIEPNAEVDDARAVDLADTAGADGIGLVILADEVGDGPDAFAEDLVDAVA
ncbi:MAG: hypothetical protein HKN26_04410, partial [Acidimicrobiales bacterium]|nr:hypothetical protein [Acidimicrobiales bacterium]